MPRRLEITEPMKKHVQELRAKGCNDKEIAEGLGISISSYKKYKKLFTTHIKKGEEIFSATKLKDIENALLKRAEGYEYKEIKKEITSGGENEYIKETVTIKHMPPDTTAQFFALVNRAPDRWQSVNKVEVKANDVELPEITINLKD